MEKSKGKVRKDDRQEREKRDGSLRNVIFPSSLSPQELATPLHRDLRYKSVVLFRLPRFLDHALVDPGDGDEMLRSRGRRGRDEEESLSELGSGVKNDVGGIGEGRGDERGNR